MVLDEVYFGLLYGPASTVQSRRFLLHRLLALFQIKREKQVSHIQHCDRKREVILQICYRLIAL